MVFLFNPYKSYSSSNSAPDYGIITLMYHRFEENKYPSTNVKIKDFKDHLNLIINEGFSFVNPDDFESELKNKTKKKLLLTVDDGFLSFYENAWPILKSKKIPFILFVSTREVGKKGYMTWSQINEVAKEDFAHIGNHSHSHEYLIDENKNEVMDDLKKSISIFKNKMGYNSHFFSYPFGEYSVELKEIVNSLKFKFAFGQHSGVVDDTKDLLELPRFPINEKYGEIKRFKTILKTLPFKFKKINPEEKYIFDENNPPKVSVEFFDDIKNIKLINCYSNEENKWRKSEIIFKDNNKIEIKLKGKFITERGRINCSLREDNGLWRWLGVQFVIAEK
ncbi:MAG: polysaccharide deacetylase [Pelagibacteraceae bacterium TMED287]|nr:MAG: polysaccharide deacetylase [Pelagibacteraceae bacterium TMED287]